MKFVVLFFVMLNQVVCLSQKSILKAEIDKIIQFDTEINIRDTPGFLVGVVDEDSTYILAFGHKVEDASQTLSESDIFEIGSLTKSFTSTIVMQLIEENLLKYDSKVNELLEEKYSNPRMKNLTIFDLVNHTSGLPKRPLGFGLKEVDVQNPYQNFTREDLLNFYTYYVPSSSGNKGKFEYSHTNYAILEIIIEQVTGISFEDNVFNRIFLPLNMESSLVDYFEKKNNVLTKGIDRSGELVKPWTFRSFAASEGIKSSMKDLVTYMQHLIDDRGVAMFQLRNKTNSSKQSFNRDILVQDGWQLLKINKNTTAHINSGSTSGHTAFMAIIKDTKTGVIVLSNSADGTGDLPMLILRMINYNWKRKPKLQ